MRNTDFFYDKNVTIVGLARSGLACANLLSDLGAKVSITDNQDNASTRLFACRLKSKESKIELGIHTQEFIKNRDLVVVSPGIDNSAQPVIWANALDIPIVSEIEVGSILCPATVIGVTGTNGKTTVTTLIGKILEAKGKRVFILGNIGNPLCREVDKMSPDDFVSLEVSSFQLERVKKFKPKIAVILNFSINHLDRYKDVYEYLEAKKRIFMNQDKTDYLVLNSQDAAVKKMAKDTKSEVIFFSGTEDLNPNQAALLTVGSILGIDKEMSLEVLRKFKGVEHRLEYVAESDNVEFINDSKSTNVDSTVWALKNISRPVILIAGGKDKGCDYKMVLDFMRHKVKEVILLGEAKQKIRDAFGNYFPLDEANSLEEAVKTAFNKAEPGDTVLLSPMCSSFDMFSNYEERGKVFKKAVFDLIKQKS